MRGNRLIDFLPRSERTTLLSICDTIVIPLGATLCEEGGRITHVFFPLSGFVSSTRAVTGQPALGMGLIGREGMVGATLVLGADVAPTRSVVQRPGTALRIVTRQFRSTLDRCPRLRRTLNRYVHVLMTQLSQTAVCAHFHLVEARLARQLLMAEDRAGSDQFHLTHESLADALGVRRSAITLAAGSLRASRAIRYSRGGIQILDRVRLEKAACACYGLANDAYALWLD